MMVKKRFFCFVLCLCTLFLTLLGGVVSAKETVSLISGVSLTLDESLSYDVYATLPDGQTGAKMEFTINEIKNTVSGQLQSDGRYKFTLTDILPQYICDDITAELCVGNDDNAVCETYVASIEDYCRVLVDSVTVSNNEKFAAMAVLHYGAAAQCVADYKTDALCNEGLPTLGSKDVSHKEIINNDESIWLGASAYLEETVVLKIGLQMPKNATRVSYIIGESSKKIATYANGYIYVPVLAHQFEEEIMLFCEDASGKGIGGKLTISMDSYLNSIKTDDSEINALVTSIINYGEMAKIVNGGNMARTTLTQLNVNNGMAYAIQLDDGSFIIIDGGVNAECNANVLWNYLQRNKTQEKPIIACWMITHPDNDHIAMANKFIVDHANDIEIRSFAYSFPKQEDLRTSEHYGLSVQTSGWFDAMKKFPDAKKYDVKEGDVLTFADVKVEILIDATRGTTTKKTDIDVRNDRSAAWMMIFTQGTETEADDTRFLVSGDCQDDNTSSRTASRLSALINMYGDALKADILQMPHHGLAGGSADFAKKADPKIALFPTLQANFNGNNNSQTVWANKSYNIAVRDKIVYFMDEIVVLDMLTLERI